MSNLQAGLDLGQVRDFSALAVVERLHVLPPGMSYEHWERHQDDVVPPTLTEEVHVRHLQRWQLGTPYGRIVDDVGELMRRDEMADAWLYFDATGVGVAVRDMLMQAYTAGRMGAHWPLAITLTGADRSTGRHVAKRDLMSRLQVLLQQGRLRIAAGLPLADVLERELTSFRLKLSAAGRDSYEVQRREGEGHGDLTIAVALAAYRVNPSAAIEVVETAATV